MEALYFLHVACAIGSISGFALRGYWMQRNSPLLSQRIVKVLPHLVDTLLLASAIGMLVHRGMYPWHAGWLMAKILALLVYIALGSVALRYGKTRRGRVIAWFLALVCAAYIVSVALTKSPFGPLTML